MKNLEETNEVAFLNEEAASQKFEEVCGSDKWINVLASQTKAVPIENMPIFLEKVRADACISDNISDDSIRENMDSGMQLGFSFPMDGKMTCIPIGETGFLSGLQRAGYQAATCLSGTEAKREFIPMAASDRAMVVNIGLKTQKEKEFIILVRDEKVRYMGSSEYKILPFNELHKIFKDGLKDFFSDVNFMQASASHEYFTVIYSLDDRELHEKLVAILDKAKYSYKRCAFACRLTSSDVGLSGANLYPYILTDGQPKVIGKPICLEHKGDATLEKFQENVSEIYSLFRASEEAVEKLGEKKLHSPAGAFKRVAKQLGMPKRQSIEGGDSFARTYIEPTWLDLYFQIYELFGEYADGSGLTQSQMIYYEEQISRIIFANNLDNLDAPFEWE